MSQPESPTTNSKASPPTFWRVASIGAAVVFGLAGVIAMLVLVGGPDLLQPAGDGGQLKDFVTKVNAIKDPATIAVGSVSSVGLLAGAGMSAAGLQSGVRTMATSAVSGGAVVLGNGVIA